MADPSLRRDRLLALLPRIYTAQPDGSAIGDLLTMMADSLTRFDDAQTRVSRDRWVGLASGVQPDGEPAALDRLARLLDRARLRGTGADTAETTEAFRQRLTISARALTGGLATPRAILALAVADLGAEVCPSMRSVPPPGTAPGAVAWRVDATIAWGVPPAARRTCPVCANGLPAGGEAVCPNRESRVLDAWIAENPPLRGFHAQPGLGYWRGFAIPNRSLEVDRPTIAIFARVDMSYPALRNQTTGETVLFAGILRAGETLTIEPGLGPVETGPFNSYDNFPHHTWLPAQPGGAARISRPGTPERDAGRDIFFISGAAFDAFDSVYGAGPPAGGGEESGTRFSILDNIVRTPLLRSGADTWVLLRFANPARTFDDPDSRYAGPNDAEGTRFAKWDGGGADKNAEPAQILFEAMRDAEQAAAAEIAAGTPQPPVADVTLEWFTRPPATFRLRIPRTPWVAAAEARGAIDVLLADVQLARPAGVLALVDFPEPPFHDGLAPGEDWGETLSAHVAQTFHEDANPSDGLPHVAIQHGARREVHDIGDSVPVWAGRFDVTRFDAMVLV